MITVDQTLTPAALTKQVERFFELAAGKIRGLRDSWNSADGSPVFTVEGRYTARGWTDWTQGFQFGCAILQYDATGDEPFLEIGAGATRRYMTPHLTHMGVHDHGFNTVSTHGNLLRLIREGRLEADRWQREYHELALKVSGAVQAARWTELPSGLGFVHSFNGPHSLFSDTIRSMRALVVSHQLGHVLMGERDHKIDLLDRALRHTETTASYNVYFGAGRDAYDVRGRVAHESIFNLNDGFYRNASTQQGYSPFSTWTRGLAWILLGFAEQLEFLASLEHLQSSGPFEGREEAMARFREVATATADFYFAETPTDGIPYWDTGAPGLVRMGDYLGRPSDPYNDWEPVDSSAAAISAQGLIRLGNWLTKMEDEAGDRYLKAGLTVARTLFDEPYLSVNPKHQGLILHSVYHRPNGWDHIPAGRKVPCGESSMWGDYHAMELALMIHRMATGAPYYRFFL